MTAFDHAQAVYDAMEPDYYDTDDFGPPDSDDGSDRDEYEPGGRFFD